MNKQEARAVLRSEMARWRQKSWSELEEHIGHQGTEQRHGPSGTVYQLEIQTFWDDESKEVIRCLGAIDDGGWRAYSPLTEDFLMRQDGSFVGEEN